LNDIELIVLLILLAQLERPPNRRSRATVDPQIGDFEFGVQVRDANLKAPTPA
jgi:hypothetical protein